MGWCLIAALGLLAISSTICSANNSCSLVGCGSGIEFTAGEVVLLSAARLSRSAFINSKYSFLASGLSSGIKAPISNTSIPFSFALANASYNVDLFSYCFVIPR